MGTKRDGGAGEKEKLRPRETGETARGKSLRFERPLASTKGREGPEAVRAHNEEAFARLEYEARLVGGTADRSVVIRHMHRRLETGRKRGKNALLPSGELLASIMERARAAKKNPRARQRLRPDIQRDMARYLELRRAEMVTVMARRSVAMADPQFQVFVRGLEEHVPDNYEKLGKRKQLEIARVVVVQNGLEEKPEEIRAFLVGYEKQEDDVHFVEKALAEERFTAALVEQAASSEDPEKAFVESLKSASPELRKAYEEYVSGWASEEMQDVFGVISLDFSFGEGRPVSNEKVGQVVRDVQAAGAQLHMSSDTAGEVHFGSLVRDVELYEVNGEPKLFIFDRNADRGVRGPVDPALVRDELWQIKVDDYFSARFREFATADSEKDPSKILDSKLLKMVSALVPQGEGRQTQEFDSTQRRVLTNLARIFVTPDVDQVSMEDRTRFFAETVVSQPDRLALARNWLKENDLAGQPMSVSEFASQFS